MLKQRIITAIILAPLALAGVFLLDPIPFSYFVAAVLALAGWEWANLAGYSDNLKRVIYACCLAIIMLFVLPLLALEWVLTLSVLWWAFATLLVLTYPGSVSLWRHGWARLLFGVFIIAPMWKALVFLRSAEFAIDQSVSTLWLIFYVLLLVWTADTGAYFAGRRYGNKKLAPAVSPGKSWAGAWGGMLATSALAIMASAMVGLSFPQAIALIVMTVVVSAISIIGDLTESMFKRQRGIKDSSNLLPGHGGILDRIDSLVAAIPVFVFALHAMGWIV